MRSEERMMKTPPTQKQMASFYNISTKTIRAIKKESPKAFAALQKAAIFGLIKELRGNDRPTEAQVGYFEYLTLECRRYGIPTKKFGSTTFAEISESIHEMKKSIELMEINERGEL